MKKHMEVQTMAKKSRKKQKKSYVQRSKTNYHSARTAWASIAKARGLEPRQVKEAHTRTHWRWRIR